MSSELSLIVSNSFDAHCTAGTSVTQVIDINGIDIVADAGCELDIKNYARAEAECDMDGVIETLTGAILDSSTFAQTALRLIGRQTPCDSDDCVSSMRAALRNHLTMRCSSTVQAQQSVSVQGGGNLVCKGERIRIGNYSDLRAECLVRTMEDLDRPDIEVTETLETSQKNETPETTPGNSIAPESLIVLGVGVVVLLLILVGVFMMSMRKKRRRVQAVPDVGA